MQLGDIAGTKISRPQLEVGEAEIDRTIEIMRKQRVHTRLPSARPRKATA